jgi:hypothetical protein
LSTDLAIILTRSEVSMKSLARWLKKQEKKLTTDFRFYKKKAVNVVTLCTCRRDLEIGKQCALAPGTHFPEFIN